MPESRQSPEHSVDEDKQQYEGRADLKEAFDDHGVMPDSRRKTRSPWSPKGSVVTAPS